MVGTFVLLSIISSSGACSAVPANGLDELQFNEVVAVVEAIYAPIVAARGAELIITKQWRDDRLNAFPSRFSSVMALTVSGGLARSRGMTQDGFALVVCHELGHLLGGFPQGNPGMANEGQADYFATAKCLRKVFSDPAARRFSRPDFEDPTATRSCAAAFAGPEERAICVRSAMAALSASKATAGWGKERAPALDSPDPYHTTVTDDRHMPRQCRLDTQFQGALCRKPASEDFSSEGPNPGACTRSQGFTVGLRPRCWYQPPESEPDY